MWSLRPCLFSKGLERALAVIKISDRGSPTRPADPVEDIRQTLDLHQHAVALLDQLTPLVAHRLTGLPQQGGQAVASTRMHE